MKSFAIAALCMAGSAYAKAMCRMTDADGNRNGGFMLSEKKNVFSTKFTTLADGDYTLSIVQSATDSTLVGTCTEAAGTGCSD